MVHAVHLLTIKRLHRKFQQLALAVPRDQLLRGPTLQEALDADKSVWNAVLAVQIENKWPFNDALNEVAYCRQEMQSLLQPRIRTQSRPDKRQAPDHPKSPGKIAKSTPHWFRRRQGKGICMRYHTGTCKAGKSCRYLHICPLPDAQGRICGGNHVAKNHRDSPH